MQPFEDEYLDEDVEKKDKINLKIKNDKSILNNIKNKDKEYKEQFEKNANKANLDYNSYVERAADLALKLKKIINDTTLTENKNPILSNLESEVIEALFTLGMDMNTDPNQVDGAGSMGIIALMLKMLLIQRDRINKLSYDLSILNKKMHKSEK